MFNQVLSIHYAEKAKIMALNSDFYDKLSDN